MGGRPERVYGRTGAETRARLLREAAVGNLRNGRKPDAATPVRDEGPLVVDLLSEGRSK